VSQEIAKNRSCQVTIKERWANYVSFNNVAPHIDTPSTLQIDFAQPMRILHGPIVCIMEICSATISEFDLSVHKAEAKYVNVVAIG